MSPFRCTVSLPKLLFLYTVMKYRHNRIFTQQIISAEKMLSLLKNTILYIIRNNIKLFFSFWLDKTWTRRLQQFGALAALKIEGYKPCVVKLGQYDERFKVI